MPFGDDLPRIVIGTRISLPRLVLRMEMTSVRQQATDGLEHFLGGERFGQDGVGSQLLGLCQGVFPWRAGRAS